MTRMLRMTPDQVEAYIARVNGMVNPPTTITTASAADSVPKKQTRSSEYERWLVNQLVAAGLPEPARQFRWLDDRRYEADLAYGALLIEIDGAAHRIKGRFMDDIEKNQQALLNGFWLLRIATSQVRNGKAVGIVKSALERVQAYGPTFDVEHSQCKVKEV